MSAKLKARIAELEDELAEARLSVIAFAGPAAQSYARERGYPPGMLHPIHYDILAKAGARMVDLRRAPEAVPPRAKIDLAAAPSSMETQAAGWGGKR